MPPQKIMLIRHGEKPVTPPPYGITEEGVQDQHSLIAQGWQRGGGLVRFFAAPVSALPIQTPTTIYASGVGDRSVFVDGDDVSKSLRPQQTVTPTARKLGLQPNIDFTVGEEQALANDILARGGVVLVAWEHKHIPAIASTLGANAPDTWPGGRFDVVWVLDRQTDGGYAFTQCDQSILAGDP
jgi:hypothetical protein